MTVGFRPTPEDTEIIRAHQRPNESTSDVLRRALRALDRERWEQEARADMERIVAADEDLSDEPDEWGYDDTGNTVDLRADQSSSRPQARSAPKKLHPGLAGVCESVIQDVLARSAEGNEGFALRQEFMDCVGLTESHLRKLKASRDSAWKLDQLRAAARRRVGKR